MLAVARPDQARAKQVLVLYLVGCGSITLWRSNGTTEFVFVVHRTHTKQQRTLALAAVATLQKQLQGIHMSHNAHHATHAYPSLHDDTHALPIPICSPCHTRFTHPYMMPHTPYPSLHAHHATHAYPSLYATAGQAPAFAASWQGKKVLTEVRKTKKFWRAPVGWLGCGGPLVGVRAGWCHAMC